MLPFELLLSLSRVLPGLGCPVSGFGFLVLDFGVGVSGFGVKGLECRV